jgi:hypothetical protein
VRVLEEGQGEFKVRGEFRGWDTSGGGGARMAVSMGQSFRSMGVRGRLAMGGMDAVELLKQDACHRGYGLLSRSDGIREMHRLSWVGVAKTRPC